MVPGIYRLFLDALDTRYNHPQITRQGESPKFEHTT